jgi:hypothetical protein
MSVRILVEHLMELLQGLTIQKMAETNSPFSLAQTAEPTKEARVVDPLYPRLNISDKVVGLIG